jgi:hypothetical protein
VSLYGRVWARDDYRVLLRSDHVQRELDDAEHDDWRAEIRRRARADRLAIRTASFPSPASPPRVWAGLPARRRSEPEKLTALREARRKLDELRREELEREKAMNAGTAQVMKSWLEREYPGTVWDVTVGDSVAGEWPQ